jgi:hypothetical protein
MPEPTRDSEDAEDKWVRPPWSEAQVAALNGYQVSGVFHPFTCPRRGDTPHTQVNGDKGGLRATAEGWVCESCDYTQDWAWAWMADEDAWRAMDWRNHLPPPDRGDR